MYNGVSDVYTCTAWQEEASELRQEVERMQQQHGKTEGLLRASLQEVMAIAEQLKREKAAQADELSEAKR